MPPQTTDPFKSAIEMVRNIRVSSVLGSLLFIAPFTLMALVVISFTTNIIVQTFLIWLNGSIFGVFILCYLGILFWGDHKELQSEDHAYRMRALDVIGDQNNLLPSTSTLLENNPLLPSPGKSLPPPSDNKK